ncbi:MAG: hypothetical protein K0U78_15870 [Actinomycetia bacterium]|nr:hypothetical protein [Actinomycetes bacterium]
MNLEVMQGRVVMFSGNMWDFRTKFIPETLARIEAMPNVGPVVEMKRKLLQQWVSIQNRFDSNVAQMKGAADPSKAHLIREALENTPIEVTRSDTTFGQQWVNAFRDAGRFLASLVNVANPVLVAGRAAFLKLVRSNVAGLATSLQPKLGDKLKNKWKALGGDYSILAKAVRAGASRGIGVVPMSLVAASTAGGNSGGGKDGVLGLWAKAKPIIEDILKALGISLDPADASSSASIPTDPGVQGAVDDADGDAEGKNNWLPVLLLAGAVLALSDN